MDRCWNKKILYLFNALSVDDVQQRQTTEEVDSSVVRYLGEYRDTKRDDTSIAKVTVYCGLRYHQLS